VLECCPVRLTSVLLAGWLSLSPQAPVFRTGVDLVNVGVTVTDKKGVLATDLTADDFDIYEDGRKQETQQPRLVRLERGKALADESRVPLRSRDPVTCVSVDRQPRWPSSWAIAHPRTTHPSTWPRSPKSRTRS
jgi:hypothetical protein